MSRNWTYEKLMLLYWWLLISVTKPLRPPCKVRLHNVKFWLRDRSSFLIRIMSKSLVLAMISVLPIPEPMSPYSLRIVNGAEM